jgi:hypothetical protein
MNRPYNELLIPPLLKKRLHLQEEWGSRRNQSPIRNPLSTQSEVESQYANGTLVDGIDSGPVKYGRQDYRVDQKAIYKSK